MRASATLTRRLRGRGRDRQAHSGGEIGVDQPTVALKLIGHGAIKVINRFYKWQFLEIIFLKADLLWHQ